MADRPAPQMSDEDYRAIAAFRAALRRFLRFSEEAARGVGLTPQQHQLLLAIRGHGGPDAPTIGSLAEALQVRHHSAVGLVNRLEQAGHVRREGSPIDSRRVHVLLTPAGEAVLDALAGTHRHEYHRLEGVLHRLIERLDGA